MTSISDELLSLFPFVKKENLTKSARLEEDLGIYGDDAEELMLKFSDKFNINIGELDLSKYFTRETAFYFLYVWFPILRNKRRKSLTIHDLEKVINGEMKL